MFFLNTMTNGGSQLQGQFTNIILFPIVVHFKHNYMANILSFKNIYSIPGVRMTIDIEQEDVIVITFKDGNTFKFNPYSNSLFYFDTATVIFNNKPKYLVTNYSLIQTVNANKEFFTVNEIEGVDVWR